MKSVVGAVLMGIAAVAGCARSPSGAPPESDSGRRAIDVENRKAVVERTHSIFQTALYYKPLESSASAELVSLSPLIVQEASDPASNGAATSIADVPRVAGWEQTVEGRWHRNVKRPMVYYRDSIEMVKGHEHRQLCFLWWVSCEDEFTPHEKSWRGFRMTLGRDGFPAIWEMLGDAPGPRFVFASKSLEDAAVKERGPAADVQRFAIEGDGGGSDGEIVARILDDGPMPMGPFVYLRAGDGAVTTLLCRCVASQVRDFQETCYYELRPLSELGVAEAAVMTPAPRRLERLLRLPADF